MSIKTTRQLRTWLALFLGLMLPVLAACGSPPGAAPADTAPVGRLVLATTTSTENSGLLQFILPDFEAQYQAEVEVVAVGTGQALELGRNGDADVVLVHARALEDEFVADGWARERFDVMYNDFIIVGPASDPAGVAGSQDAAAALTQIANTESTFVSRGDNSGTHTKELNLWEAAGITPSGDWYQSAGQGMGAVLTLADELQAYTLSDRATYLARTLEGLDLEILVEGDTRLFNPYGVMAINPDKHPHVNHDGAQTFIAWLTSLEAQTKIGEFGRAEFGQSLFIPDSVEWRASQN